MSCPGYPSLHTSRLGLFLRGGVFFKPGPVLFVGKVTPRAIYCLDVFFETVSSLVSLCFSGV